MIKQSRSVGLVCYSRAVINRIIQYSRCQKWCYICHNKDKDKTTHWHIIIWRNSPYTIQTIIGWQKLLKKEFDKNYNITYEMLRSFRGSFDYLTHEDNPEKYHYSKKDIKANFNIEYDDLVIERNACDAVELILGGLTPYQIVRSYPRLIHSISQIKAFYELHCSERQRECNNAVLYPLPYRPTPFQVVVNLPPPQKGVKGK